MKNFIRCCAFVISILSLLQTDYSIAEETQSLELFGRSSGVDYKNTLDATDMRWLSNKGVLILGVSAPDYEPFDVVVGEKYYEGLTADYAKLVSDILHVSIVVRRFTSHQIAVEALEKGEVDLLGSASGFDTLGPDLVMSKMYSKIKPVLVTRNSDRSSMLFNLSNKTIALVDHYLPKELVQRLYPDSQVKLYSSPVTALQAVLFGQADAYLGDTASSHFLASRNYLDDLSFTDFSRLEAQPLGFAMKSNNQQLLRVVNYALAAIPFSERFNISRRWSGGALLTQKDQFSFSLNEQRWMQTHSHLKIAALDDWGPISFFDEKGRLVGISADVLKQISRDTGLIFDPVPARNPAELFELLKKGKVNLVLNNDTNFAKAQNAYVSRPYLIAPMVLLVSGRAHDIEKLDDLKNRKLAEISQAFTSSYVSNHYPEITAEKVESPALGAKAVAIGQVDGALMNLMSARHQVNVHYHDQLRIVAGGAEELGSAYYTFATNIDSLELQSILDKALMNIPPEELDKTINYWENKTTPSVSGELKINSLAIRGLVIGALMLLTALAWIIYLRGLVKKRKRAEQALSTQVALMRELVDGVPHPTYVRDRSGRLLICNEYYLRAIDQSLEQVLYKTTHAITSLTSVLAQAMHEEYLLVMEADIPRVQDRVIQIADGQCRAVYQWLRPFKGGDGVVAGLAAGWIDISERHDLLEELRAAKERSDDSNRAKSTFLATMSHEIRTPINAVLGMLELAQKKAAKGIVDQFAIDVASGAASELLELVGNILDVARIESGRLTLAPERANLYKLTETVVRIFDGMARQKHLRLKLDFDFSHKSDVLIDPIRFKQIISNLLINAIKFTATGGVSLHVSTSSDLESERLKVKLVITDTGIGISAEDQIHLFTPFKQASNHNQSSRHSSGLGLTISRALCEMMDGQLQISSDLGEGTRVEVLLDLITLPNLPEIKASAAEPPPLNIRLNILVIDDYPANRLLLCQQLSYLGHQISEAEDGGHGLHEWRKGNFDVIITDCNMPVMSGYELASTVRNEESKYSLHPCLILGFTANVQSEEKRRCLDAGMDDCLFKPITLKDLVVYLDRASPAPNRQNRPTLTTLDNNEIDIGGLEQLTQGNPITMRKLLIDLASSNEDDLLRLVQLFIAKDLPGLSDLAHRVKGGARIIKAIHLIQCCELMEDACSSPDSANLLGCAEGLQLAMEHLAHQLDEYIKP